MEVEVDVEGPASFLAALQLHGRSGGCWLAWMHSYIHTYIHTCIQYIQEDRERGSGSGGAGTNLSLR